MFKVKRNIKLRLLYIRDYTEHFGKHGNYRIMSLASRTCITYVICMHTCFIILGFFQQMQLIIYQLTHQHLAY